MHKHLRWTITASFYICQSAILAYSTHSRASWQVIVEPNILLECFIGLGLIASDYLTPSLSQISRDVLHISDKVSGLTLLALGNSIPDITSTYQAMSSGATSLALGELFGGIFFLLTVVLGIMALVRPIELRPNNVILAGIEDVYLKLDSAVVYNRIDFFQDIIIFGVLILVSAVFLADGQLMFWECVTMIIAYVVYTSFLILQHRPFSNDATALDTECTNDSADLSTIISNSNIGNNDEENILLFNRGIKKRRADIRGNIRQYLRSRYNGWVKITLSDCFDIWENEARMNRTLAEETEQNSFITVDDQVESNYFTPIRRTNSLQLANECQQLPIIHGVEIEDNQSIPESAISSIDNSSINFQRLPIPSRPITQKSLSCDCIPNLSTYLQEQNARESRTQTAPIYSNSREILVTWPCDLKLFQYLSDDSMYLPLTEFLALLFTTPVTIMLSCLIPYLGHMKDSGHLHLLEVTRLCLVPFALCFILTGALSIWSLTICSLLATVLVYRWFKSRVRHNKNIVATAGFLLSLAMIYSCVHIVVKTLSDWSTKFKISPSILGLTIFAWGNSMGDLVSNIIFVDIGVIELALGACFGSPLLYFVFGVGVDGIVLMFRQQKHKQTPILNRHLDYTVDRHMGYTAVGILVAFLIFLVAVPLNRWRIDKKISICLLVLYATVTAVNIYQEVI